MSFKLTYSTMFDPPPELHSRFDAALETVRAALGAEHPMLIGGADERARRAVRAARAGRHAPAARPLPGRRARARRRGRRRGATRLPGLVAATRGASAWRCCAARSQLIEERVYEIGAALALEVGKNRMEALGEAQETADLIA